MPLSTCARGCCWTPYGCAQPAACDCHPETLTNWLGAATNETAVRLGHRDPTASQAVDNVMRQRKGGPR